MKDLLDMLLPPRRRSTVSKIRPTDRTYDLLAAYGEVDDLLFPKAKKPKTSVLPDR